MLNAINGNSDDTAVFDNSTAVNGTESDAT